MGLLTALLSATISPSLAEEGITEQENERLHDALQSLAVPADLQAENLSSERRAAAVAASEEELSKLKQANFDPKRAPVYHYMIWANGYDAICRAGTPSPSRAPTSS
jgi:hypothetical protein